jgi:hypothetical protein
LWRSAPCHTTGSWWKMTITIRLAMAMAHTMVCDVTSPLLTSPDSRHASEAHLLDPSSLLVGRVFPSCSGSVLGGSGFCRGSIPWGSLPCLAECPAWIFFLPLGSSSEQRTFWLRRPVALLLFSRETFLPLSACQHTDTHTDRHADKQTDRQTDRQIMVCAMPCQGGRGGESVVHHAMPCHNATMVQTSRKLAALLASFHWF